MAGAPKATALFSMVGDGAIPPASSIIAAAPKLAKPSRTMMQKAEAMANLELSIAQ